ncbi:MAG: hypothetical protein EBT70_15925, partial [Betaproteobacteria bacterium]|nr:hypothetical protein [Betaproteobacteria bacterium]
GDWVESRSALVEHVDGRLELIYWDQVVDFVPAIEPSISPVDVRPAPIPVAMPVASSAANTTH